MDNLSNKDFEEVAIYAAKVTAFLIELSRKYPERWKKAIVDNDLGHEDNFPKGDLSLGHALWCWDKFGNNPHDMFSPGDPHQKYPFIMEFRRELTEKFGLPVLSYLEALDWKRAYSGIKFIRNNVVGWGD